jgi:hypothetical protein
MNPSQAFGQLRRLPAPDGIEGHIGASLQPMLDVPIGLPVPGQIHPESGN